MKWLQFLPFEDESAAGSRLPFVPFMMVLLVLAWSASTTAVRAGNQYLAPELMADQGDDLEPEDTPVLDSKPPRHLRRNVVVSPEVDAEPPSIGPCAEEDDRACGESPCCPGRLWSVGPCWPPLANRMEARGEWLFWWGKGNYVPALVTTRSQHGNPGSGGRSRRAGHGHLVFGNSDLNDAARSGARITLDYWLTCDHTVGLEAQYFGLGDDTASFQANSNSFPVLARPFFNVQTWLPTPASSDIPARRPAT